MLLTSQRQQMMFSTTQTNSPSSNGKTFVPFKASGTQVTAETPSKESNRGGSINDERRNISPNWGQMKQRNQQVLELHQI